MGLGMLSMAWATPSGTGVMASGMSSKARAMPSGAQMRMMTTMAISMTITMMTSTTMMITMARAMLMIIGFGAEDLFRAMMPCESLMERQFFTPQHLGNCDPIACT